MLFGLLIVFEFLFARQLVSAVINALGVANGSDPAMRAVLTLRHFLSHCLLEQDGAANLDCL